MHGSPMVFLDCPLWGGAVLTHCNAIMTERGSRSTFCAGLVMFTTIQRFARKQVLEQDLCSVWVSFVLVLQNRPGVG